MPQLREAGSDRAYRPRARAIDLPAEGNALICRPSAKNRCRTRPLVGAAAGILADGGRFEPLLPDACGWTRRVQRFHDRRSPPPPSPTGADHAMLAGCSHRPRIIIWLPRSSTAHALQKEPRAADSTSRCSCPVWTGWAIGWHILLPAFTVGLASIAVLEGLYFFQRDEIWLRISRFRIRIFAVSFAMVSSPASSCHSSCRPLGPLLRRGRQCDLAHAGLRRPDGLLSGGDIPRRAAVRPYLVLCGAFRIRLHGRLRHAPSFWILSANSWMQRPHWQPPTPRTIPEPARPCHCRSTTT